MNRAESKFRARKTVRRKTLSATEAAGLIPTRPLPCHIDKMMRLANNADPLIREGALKTLAQIRGEKAEVSLISAIRDHDERVRAAAYEGLGVIRLKKFTDQIAKALRDTSDLVRCAAATGLGLLGDKRGLNVLLQFARPRHPLKWKALRGLNLVTGNTFPINSDGLKEATRWVQKSRRLS